MKKLIFAVAAIIVAFTGCKNNTTPATTGAEENTTDRVKTRSEMSVAYVNLDSLMVKYELANELRTTFQNKYDRADRDLTNKYKKFEKDMIDAQDKVQKGLVTRAQAAELEQKLANQQQELMASRERVMGELAEEEQVMNNRLYYAVSDYLKEYNADLKHSMIISTTTTGPVLHADPALDITADVVRGLNDQYTKQKAEQGK